MLNLLKERNRFNETIFLGILSLSSFGFSIFRFLYTDTKVFLFLNWNLFLAFLPWAFTSLAILKPKIQESRFFLLFLLCSWLLFFPNAPYILTDLFHLRLRSSIPIWFDLILILSFAWTGLLFGFLSLWDIERILSKKIKSIWINILSIILLFLGSFGIYVGRFLRWNSWDIIAEPFRVMYDIGDRFINPLDHPRAWGMTIFMGIFLNILYWSFRLIRKRDNEITPPNKKYSACRN